jgi:uncharacterized protein (DUF1778 family)
VIHFEIHAFAAAGLLSASRSDCIALNQGRQDRRAPPKAELFHASYRSNINSTVRRNLLDGRNSLLYDNCMGRPPKDPALRMSVDLRIPVTESQKQMIFAAASANEADVASWIRPLLLEAAHEALNKAKRLDQKWRAAKPKGLLRRVDNHVSVQTQ